MLLNSKNQVVKVPKGLKGRKLEAFLIPLREVKEPRSHTDRAAKPMFSIEQRASVKGV